MRLFRPSEDRGVRESKRQLLRENAQIKEQNKRLCLLIIALREKIRKLEKEIDSSLKI